jgi:SAM-dependent methyltransferase
MLDYAITQIATRVFPSEFRRWLRRKQHRHRLQWPRKDTLRFGDLRRLRPISAVFGRDRGTPVDRYYIENFMRSHSEDVKGHVLEIGDDTYTKKFGGERVTKSDVLHVVEGNRKATIIGDLTRAGHIPADTFDCIIFTQTLQMIYDFRSALHNLHRILKPQGTILATTHGISKICRQEGIDSWGEYWHFTCQSARKIFHEIFSPPNVQIKVYGNVLAGVAALHGLAAEELDQDELDYCDPLYEVLIAVKAVKRSS